MLIGCRSESEIEGEPLIPSEISIQLSKHIKDSCAGNSKKIHYSDSLDSVFTSIRKLNLDRSDIGVSFMSQGGKKDFYTVKIYNIKSNKLYTVFQFKLHKSENNSDPIEITKMIHSLSNE